MCIVPYIQVVDTMKRKTTKQHRSFKLDGDIDKRLRKEAKETKRTQTAVLQMALEAFFASGGVK